jgi:hypothetical protein
VEPISHFSDWGKAGETILFRLRDLSLKDSAKSVVNTVVVKAAGGFN